MKPKRIKMKGRKSKVRLLIGCRESNKNEKRELERRESKRNAKIAREYKER
jgi:hypothetical protein